MKISLYSPLDPTLIGGMRTWLLDFWTPYTAQRNLELQVVHTGTRPASSAAAYKPLPTSDRIRIVQINGRPIPGSGANLPSVAELAGAIEGSDALYFDNGYVLQDIISLRSAKISGVRAISGHHSVILHRDSGIAGSFHNAVWNAIGKRVLPRFAAVHALNAADAAYLRSIGGQNVSVIPLPVDLDTFTTGEKAAEFTVLFVGRLHMQKGIDRLVRIVDGLLKEPNISVRIVGAGPDAGRLQRFERVPRVVTLSGLSRECVASEMRRAHALVAPSRTETFGFVAAEALASGTPVVASATNGFLDLVTGSNGRIIRDAEDTAAWVRSILAIRDLSTTSYSELCREARSSVMRLGFDNIALGMDALIAKARSSC
jgi:glycosyltransferase involved in cell wall biosynthesis